MISYNKIQYFDFFTRKIQKISVDEVYNDIQCIMKFGGKKNRKIPVNGVIRWIETACSGN